MADETEPDAKPITVSELIARSADDAFPRAEPMSVRRADEATTGATASGMPEYRVPAERETPRRVGASGMPGYTPPTAADDDPNSTTGVIPAVADDFIDQELPVVDRFDDTDFIETVSDESAVDETTVLDAPVDESPTGPVAEPEVPADSSDTTADDAPEAAPTGRAARRAARAERRAAAKPERIEAAGDDRSPTIAWLALIGELVLGLVVGAGLFWGFTELWQSWVYLALALAIVVIFAIVTFAHLLRKRDLPTTLLALAVGLIVTVGPLVLLAAQP